MKEKAIQPRSLGRITRNKAVKYYKRHCKCRNRIKFVVAPLKEAMSWTMRTIRKRYVDDAAVVVALARRIAKAAAVKHRVKHTAK
ncbi:MAG: hypothetical protein U0S50_15770 [Sphingopyxis sp.]|uniref:hypothetical protein n=1 Tax=Sphingopyxis sp. TaxID=1908224 RepID=UPI002AB9AB1F|nr:hypothetical protein [Sphingopyxis sp.]MDZ3833255.1 hypothetical protein [Sphingopyxis sp.]